MDSFLSELESEGAIDSEGVFTIDSTKAKMKLAEYQLAQFNLYPDFFVSAAVASGSESLDLTLRSNPKIRTGVLTTLYFRGWTLSQNDLESLNLDSRKTSLSRSLQPLSVGLSALSSRFPITLRSKSDDPETIAVRIFKGAMETSRSKDHHHPSNTTTLRIPYDLSKDFLASFRRLSPWLPLRLSFNQGYVPTGPSAFLNFDKADRFLVGPECPEWFRNDLDPNRTEFVEEKSDEQQSYWLAKTTPEEASISGLVLLLDGKAYPVLTELCQFGVCGYLSATGLSTDISFTGLNKNREYDERVQRLRKLVCDLILSLLTCGRTLSRSCQLDLHLLLNTLSTELDLEKHWRAFDKALAKVEPTADKISLRLQERLIAKMSDEEYAELQKDYLPLIELHRQKGLPSKAATYLDHKIKTALLHNETPTNTDLFQKSLFRALLGGEFPTQSRISPALDNYLEIVSDWQLGKRNPNDSHLAQVPHSWLLPMALHRGTRYGVWSDFDKLEFTPRIALFDFLRNASEGLFDQALQILREDPTLAFEEEPRLWYSYLWFCLRGKMPYSRAVSFRVKLSLLQAQDSGYNPFRWSLDELDNFLRPRTTLVRFESAEKLVTHAVEVAYFQTSFSPIVSTLLSKTSYTPLEQTKRLWVGLICQSLLLAVRQVPDGECPLQVPFLSGTLSATAGQTHP